jgi:uncharacterized protein
VKLRTIALAGLGALVYARWEARAYRLRTVTVPVAPGAPDLDILHLTDTHMTGYDRTLGPWLEALPDALEKTPDLVIATGDMIDDNTGIDRLIKAVEGLQGRYGRYYVLGSHDYYQTTVRGFLKGVRKLYRGARPPTAISFADTARLEAGLTASGWVSVMNETVHIDAAGGSIRLAGVSDPIMKRHRTDHITRSRGELAIGLMHSPELVSEWALAGYDLILAGHTHGGQIRVPLWGALVTNSSLPPQLASGLSRVGNSHLYVGPGLGTGKFAPIRFACRPEATLLRLRAT